MDFACGELGGAHFGGVSPPGSGKRAAHLNYELRI